MSTPPRKVARRDNYSSVDAARQSILRDRSGEDSAHEVPSRPGTPQSTSGPSKRPSAVRSASLMEPQSTGGEDVGWWISSATFERRINLLTETYRTELATLKQDMALQAKEGSDLLWSGLKGVEADVRQGRKEQQETSQRYERALGDVAAKNTGEHSGMEGKLGKLEADIKDSISGTKADMEGIIREEIARVQSHIQEILDEKNNSLEKKLGELRLEQEGQHAESQAKIEEIGVRMEELAAVQNEEMEKKLASLQSEQAERDARSRTEIEALIRQEIEQVQTYARNILDEREVLIRENLEKLVLDQAAKSSASIEGNEALIRQEVQKVRVQLLDFVEEQRRVVEEMKKGWVIPLLGWYWLQVCTWTDLGKRNVKGLVSALVEATILGRFI